MSRQVCWGDLIMDIHNSIRVYKIQLWIFVTELCTSVSNDGYPKFTTIMDIYPQLNYGWMSLKMQWSQYIAQLMLPVIQLYNSVIFVGAMLVYRPSCNAEGGCHANSARAKRGLYWLWQPPEALQEGRYTSVAPEQNHAIIIITTWSHSRCIIVL